MIAPSAQAELREEIAFSLHDVSFSFRNAHPVLSGLTINGRGGEIGCLVGANGAGKTTTFMLLAGLLEPSRGNVNVAGILMRRSPRRARLHTGFVPDVPLLYDTLTATENLTYFGLLWGLPRRGLAHRVEELLVDVKLTDELKTPVGKFSRGMKQRLAISAALVHKPTVLLLDEPFSALDLNWALWLEARLHTFCREGGAVLLTANSPEHLDVLADRTWFLANGRVVREYDKGALADAGGARAVIADVTQNTLVRA